MKFILPLCPPLNQVYRHVGNRVYKSAKAREWEKEAGWEIKRQRETKKPIGCNVEVFISLYLRRDRDIDSSQKLLLDVMEKVGVYKNDRQVHALHVFKEKTNNDPAMIVQVDELE